MTTLTIAREKLLRPLQIVASTVEKRQALPILSHLLFSVKGGVLSLVGTDLEVELVARIPLDSDSDDISFAVPARKVVDICKALPESADIKLTVDASKVLLQAGRSRYTLSALGAEDYPRFEETAPGALEFSIAPKAVRELFAKTAFAMALQDVRYYLNGLLFWVGGDHIRAVATDGHRLATQAIGVRLHTQIEQKVIIPRKAVLELNRLLADETEELGLVLGENHLRVVTPRYSFSTKLIDGNFPDYKQVLPKGDGFVAVLSREGFRDLLQRVSVLFSDKNRGVSLGFSGQQLQVRARNQEQDEAEDVLDIAYDGPERRIGLNVSYLLEYLSIIKTEKVRLIFSDPNAPVLITQDNEEQDDAAYVVMPMRL